MKGCKKMYEIKERLKIIAGEMMNQTLQKLLNEDKSYQEISGEERKAYEAYEKLALSEEQRRIVDILLAKNNEAQFEYHDNAYLAGMLDAYVVFQQFGLIEK